MDPIALSIVQELHRRRMTVTDLAERTGVNRSVLGRWLAGTRTIKARDAALAMEALDLVIVRSEDLRFRPARPAWDPRAAPQAGHADRRSFRGSREPPPPR